MNGTNGGRRPVHGRGLILPAPAPPAPGDDEPDDDEWDDTEPAVMAHGRVLPATPAGDTGPAALRLLPAGSDDDAIAARYPAVTSGSERVEEAKETPPADDFGDWTRQLEPSIDNPRPLFVTDI